MADVTVVANEVLPDSGTSNLIYGTFGATVTAGETVYLDSATNTYKLADAGAASTAVCVGIAMNSGVSGQQCTIAGTGSTIDPGFTVTVGTIYVLSNTAGKIAPAADLANPMKTVVLGVGITASQLALRIYYSGATVA